MSARFRARRRAVDEVVARAASWANRQPDVASVVVVGSYARERPRMGSDLDLVILTSLVEKHLSDPAFIAGITPRGRVIRREQWGPLHERRVRVRSGLIVEFGIASPVWATVPLDPGTERVLTDGCKVVIDDGSIAAALDSIGHPVDDWRASG